MILTESSSAKIGASVVSAIISTSATFRQIMCYSSTTISHAIGGTIGLVKNGIARLTLTGIANYTGPTIINAGGEFVISSSSTLNGVISGSGRLWKNTAATLTLGATNTYSGGTRFFQGIIVFNSSNAFGTGLFVSEGGSDIRTSSTAVIPNNFLISSGTLGLRTVGANTVVITGDISGVGSINKSGNGIYDLQGNLSYTGSTNITTGTIRAYKIVGASQATANFTTSTNLGVSFNVPPAAGTQTYRFFQGSTNRSYTSVTLTNAAGRTGTYNSSNSTLTII